MASPVLAQSSFITGPLDRLITQDVYAATNGTIVNAIESLAAKYNVDLIGLLRAGQAAAQIVPIVEGIANGSLLLNPQAAIARLLTASNVLVSAVGGATINSAFSALSSGVQTALGAAGSVLGTVEATVGGVVSTIANGAISDIQGLGSLINTFAGANGSFLMVDTQALGGMAAGIINQCAKLGVAGAFSQMVSAITDPRVLQSIVAQTLPSLIRVSDIVSLQALASIAGQNGVASVNPNMLSDFSGCYSNSASGNASQATPSSDLSTWNQVSTLYDTADPNWNVASRTSTGTDDDAVDLTALQGGTDDFNSVLAAGVMNSADPTTQLYGLAVAYPSSDVDTDLKATYPAAYIDPALRSTPVPVEPAAAATASTAVNAATSTTAIAAPPTYATVDGVTTATTSDGNGNTTTQTLSSGAATSVVPASNNSVASQPNVGTYVTITTGQYAGTYTTSQDGNGQAWSSTAINFGGGVAHGDGKTNYIPVNP